MTSKTTQITQITNGFPIPLKSLTQSVSYDDLDGVQAFTYPQCTGCGAATNNIVTQQHTNGFLTSVGTTTNASDFGSVGYAPTGATQSVLHSNAVQDTYTQDVVPRPTSIVFGSYAACTAPQITSQPTPANQTVPSGTSVTLSVTATGSALSYQWYAGGVAIQNATASSYVTGPLTATTVFRVDVYNACGKVLSNTVTVTVAAATLTAPTGLTAHANSIAQIVVAWNAVSGAHHYEVERRANNVYQQFTTSTPSFTDTLVVADTTYVYHVRAADAQNNTSPYSNSDLATTRFFAPIIVGQTTIQAVDFTQLLDAVNSVRAVTNAPALSWPAILPAGTPAPAVGVYIYASHIASLRSAMDQALLALGLPTGAYTDTPVNNTVTVKAVHVLELRARTNPH